MSDSELALVVKAGERAGEEHLLEGDLVLGREAGQVDVLIDDRGVSRRHASVMVEGQTAVLRDLDSSNGTYVNGEVVDGPRRLRSGDVIQVGQTELELRSGVDTTKVIVPAASANPTEIVTPPSNRRPPAPPAAAPPIYSRGGQGSPQPAPEPARGQVDDEENWPAVAALCIGALALGLLIVSIGALFPFSLAMGIGAIIAGRFGKRMVTSGRSRRFYGMARWGGRLGWISVILSIIALVLIVVVAQLLDVAADNLGDLIDQIEAEIENL